MSNRLIAIIITIVVAALSILILLLLPIGTIATRWLERQSTDPSASRLLWTWNTSRWPLSILLMLLIMGITYYFGTGIRQRFRIITPGAVFSVIVWTLLAAAFRFYVNKYGSYDKTYGTVGGVAVILFVFYLDALVLLIGAEINAEVDFACGIQRGTRDFQRSARKPLTDPHYIRAEPAAAKPPYDPSPPGRSSNPSRG